MAELDGVCEELPVGGAVSEELGDDDTDADELPDCDTDADALLDGVSDADALSLADSLGDGDGDDDGVASDDADSGEADAEGDTDGDTDTDAGRLREPDSKACTKKSHLRSKQMTRERTRYACSGFISRKKKLVTPPLPTLYAESAPSTPMRPHSRIKHVKRAWSSATA